MSDAALLASVHYQSPDGSWSSGAEAVFRVLALAPGHRGWLAVYRRVPGFKPASEAAYRWIARHRTLAGWTTRLLWGKDPAPPRAALVRWVFLRGLALLAALAFASFWLQVDGLIGRQGILPAAELMDAARTALPGASRYWTFPSLTWLGASDPALHWICAAGTAASVAAFFGFVQGPALALAWALYLTLGTIGQEFLGFQWDILLLEMLVIGALWAPAGWRPRFESEARPSRAGLWLARWLLFRLMFESGVVKLASGDAAWRNLTALWYHYETQPLPTWIGWYAHQLPHGFQKASAAAMFAVELGAPWLIFLPRNPRRVAFGALAGLQLLIALTGNYCFFNLLTGLLCLTVLDDELILRALPKAARRRLAEPASRPEAGRWTRRARRAAALAIAALGAVPLAFMLAQRVPAPLAAVYRAAQPFRSVNGYGLFAVMTTRRPEIVVEGSVDGKEWKEYVFPYKPGPLGRRPSFVAPHQPRLDWQMWFAALGDCRSNPWFIRFLGALLSGSKPVLSLLETNPFPDAPPRFVKTTVYEYRFTTWAERRKTGQWWKRAEVGPYCPVVRRD